MSELAEKAMGAPLGRLKRGLDRSLLEARYSTNPSVRANARRQALAGYGEGLASIRSGATSEAQSIYAPEYQAQVGKSQAEFGAATQRVRDQFQTDVNDYILRGNRVSGIAENPQESSTTTAVRDTYKRLISSKRGA